MTTAATAKTTTTGKRNKKTSDGSSSSNSSSSDKSNHSNMWIFALVALVAGLVTEPLWQIYGSKIVSNVQETPSQSWSDDRQLQTDEESSSTTAATTKTSDNNSNNEFVVEESAKAQYSCSPEELNDFLHDFSVPGMHLVCLDESSNLITMYYKSLRSHVLQETIEEAEGTRMIWLDVRSVLQDKLRLPAKSELKQPWALFSPTGERLELGEESLADAPIDELFSLGMFLVMEGGQWVWPGVRKGFVRQIQLDETHNATLKTLSVRPLVFSVDGFLEDDECDWIQVTAEPHMTQSGVSLMDRDKGKPATDWRTSETTFLTQKTPEILEIDRRTSRLVRIPQTHQEPPQVLRYGLNARYDQHTDYFDPSLYANDKMTMQMIAYGRRNRMATVLWYLSDVAEGGETTFPEMDNGPPVSNKESCHVGLQVKPEKGKVIIFYSLKADGKFDPRSVHGACPVREGVKWAANKWVWNEPWTY
ncbi:2(OG)-Fe(II) oxygenase superfamily protein [Nitzschia inconspicua]|uniref:2(OG)-Fe(II) oxygenase superfamily protein n=1 Tax=Nitzschia inconspicua TaxID=303405 RepID=A0A9K3Q3B2_9STRA|nr:2(OG)-Fe(II) oxygenase superfamily protein [Nitzschia inconspicua]